MSKWDEYIRQSAEQQGFVKASGERSERVPTASGDFAFTDGDSGSVTKNGARTETRLAGIEAPEVGHPDRKTGVAMAAEVGGYDARTYLAELLTNNPEAELKSTGQKDYYDRGDVSEFVTPDGKNLNVEMARSGLVSPIGNAGAEYSDAFLGATLNTMTDAGDLLTGDARRVNEVAKGVHTRAEEALNNGEIENAAVGGMLASYDRVNDHGTAKNAWNRGLHNTGDMLGGFKAAVGDAVGADGMKADGLATADSQQALAGAYPAKINTWDDVHNVSDGATYALEKTIENLPIIGLTAGTALATGGTSLAAEGVLAATGMRAAASAVARVGMKHGAAAALYGVNTGDTALQLKENGVEDFGTTALAVGVPKTMLDYASLASMTRGVTAAVSSAVKGKGFDPIKAGTEFVTNVLREGGTEGVQQIMDNAAVSYKTGKDFNFDHVKESMIAGGVVGGAFGVAQAAPGAVVSGAKGVKGMITSREPQQDIQAQLQAQSEGAKPATFVSESNSDSFDAQVEAGGEGATVLRSPEGQLVTQHPVSEAERSAYENGTPEERSAINAAHIGYGADKSAIDPETAKVVQVVAPTGGVVHEEVTNNPEEIAASLEATKRPDDAIQVTDALQAQIRRVEATGQELSAKAVEAHNAIQQMVEQGADVADIQAAASEYEAIAAEIEKAQQLHAQLSEGTLGSSQTTEGNVDGTDAREFARENVGPDSVYISDDVRTGASVVADGGNPSGGLLRGNVLPPELQGLPLPVDSGGTGVGVGPSHPREVGETTRVRSVRPDVRDTVPQAQPREAVRSAPSLVAPTNTGEVNDRSTGPSDNAGGAVPDAGTSGAGTTVGQGDNGAGSVDSGTPENNPVGGPRKHERRSTSALDSAERAELAGRLESDESFHRLIEQRATELGVGEQHALENILYEQKFGRGYSEQSRSEDIPNDYNPSADNSLFDETELPSQDAVHAAEDVDAQENVKNYATKAYYGPLLVAHQEAFTARHPTWELVPRKASNKDFFLDPQPRTFATRTEAEAEAGRLEPLYYGYIFKPVVHADGRVMLTRNKINAALSTDAMHPTRSWVHQSLPKIKVQARGAEAAIKRGTAALNGLAKSVANHSGAFYKRRTAEMHKQIQDNSDKLLKLRTPDGATIQVHAPTITEQGKLLLGEYSSYTTKAEYEFLAFKQALAGLAALGYTYDTTQSPTDNIFPPELNISPSHIPLRVKDIVDTQTALGVAEKALRIATDELYRLEGLLKAARANQAATGVQGYVRKAFMDKISAQRKVVEDLRLQTDNHRSVDPTGKDPYANDERAVSGSFEGQDVADGRSEVDRFTDNFNRSTENATRVEAKGFAGDASGFFDPTKVGTATEPVVPANIRVGTQVKLRAVIAEAEKYSVDARYRVPTEKQFVTLARVYAEIARYFNGLPDVPVLVESSSNDGSYFRAARTVTLHSKPVAAAANVSSKSVAFQRLKFLLAHEMAHAFDHHIGDVSYTSGLFVDGGAVHDEAVGLLSTNDAEFSKILEYPFMQVEETLRPRELFAQLYASYITTPEKLRAKLPTAFSYFDSLYSDTRGPVREPSRGDNAPGLVLGGRGDKPGSSFDRPAHLISVRTAPTVRELQTKFAGFSTARVKKWMGSLNSASTSFANLVLTGYEQMKKLHPATAERFRQYQAHKNQMAAYWLGVWHNNIGLSTERTQAAFAELRALGETKVVRRSDVSAEAWAVRKYLDEIHVSMLKKYSPTMGKIPNYLPQPVDTRAMISDKNAFVEILLRHPMDVRDGNARPMTAEEADGVFNALLGNSGLEGLTVDELEGAVGVGNKHRYQRVLRNPALIAELDSAGFMFADKREAMEYYITQGVNRSAFERVFGGYRPVVALLDHNGAINESLLKDKMSQAGHGELVKSGLTPDALLDEATSMGYAKMVDGYAHWYSPVSKMHDARERLRGDASNLRKFDDLTHGMLGFFGDRVSSETKLWQSRIMAGESLLTLAFSTFSSQTDWAGPALRVMQDKGVAAAWGELKAGMRAFSNAKQAQEFATAFGFIVPRQHQSVIRSMSGADHMSAGAQKTLDTLFKYNGQEWFTNQTRAFAASTGIHYFKTLAAENDNILQSYGIDSDVVNRWIAAGEHAPTQSMERNDKKAFSDAMAVHTALHKFVNESIMRPDSTQRPNWANDPRFALLWHLKSFFWAFWSTIMKPTFRSAFTQMKAGNHGEAAAQMAFIGLMLLPLAAIGWELRQLIQYSLFGADQPSDSMDGVDYTFELLNRAGVFGPAQLAFDALGTEDSGRAVARLAGPAADHLYTLIHAETDKKIYRSIPILSQLYGAQKSISD